MELNFQYHPKNKIRFVTATSLFDGHDASINIFRRLLQQSGVEIIHLGHNRSVKEVVDSAIQEDAQAICVSCYQGGHVEYFKYMKDMLNELGRGDMKLFGGGGGVIVPKEMAELHNYGITRIYSPEDGMSMGLEGIICDMLEKSDFSLNQWPKELENKKVSPQNKLRFARALTVIENNVDNLPVEIKTQITIGKKIKENKGLKSPLVLGITGTG